MLHGRDFARRMVFTADGADYGLVAGAVAPLVTGGRDAVFYIAVLAMDAFVGGAAALGTGGGGFDGFVFMAGAVGNPGDGAAVVLQDLFCPACVACRVVSSCCYFFECLFTNGRSISFEADLCQRFAIAERKAIYCCHTFGYGDFFQSRTKSERLIAYVGYMF